VTSIADKALLLRIRNKDNKVDALIDAVIRAPDVSESVLDALDQRIANEHMAWRSLIPYLYKYSRPKLFSDLHQRMTPHVFDAAELFKMGYGSECLEDQLCHELYDTAAGKGLGVFSYIFEALNESGGPRSLEMMEIIKHELYPVIKTNRIVAGAIRDNFSEEKSLSDGEAHKLVDDMSLSYLSQQLESSIELLRRKGIKLPDESHHESPNAGSASARSSSGRSRRVEHYMSKATELLPNYPSEALNNIRKAAEAICKDVLDDAFLSSPNSNRKPATAFNSLEDMINRMRKDGLIPSSVENCLASLQSFGNFASHDQEEDPQSVSVEMAESTFGHLKTVVEWYESLNLRIEQKSE
jgi:hypothetical protein